MAPAVFFGSQCSAYRHEMNRQKSVPLPNKRTVRNNSDQRRDFPSEQVQPGQHAPRDHQADADRDQRHQGQPERPIDREQNPQEQDHRGHRGAVERSLHVPHVVAANHARRRSSAGSETLGREPGRRRRQAAGARRPLVSALGATNEVESGIRINCERLVGTDQAAAIFGAVRAGPTTRSMLAGRPGRGGEAGRPGGGRSHGRVGSDRIRPH